MDYGSIKVRVKRFLDWNGANVDTYVADWVNDVRQALATTPEIDWQHLWTTETWTTSAGSSDYSLPSDYIDHKLLMLGSKKLFGIGSAEYAHQVLDDEDDPQDQDEPSWYEVRGGKIHLQPPPDAAYTLTLYYYSIPASMSSSSETDYFTINYPMYLVHEAVVMGAVFLDDEKKIALHERESTKQFGRMIRREKKRTQRDRNPVFKSWRDFSTATYKEKFRAK